MNDKRWQWTFLRSGIFYLLSLVCFQIHNEKIWSILLRLIFLARSPFIFLIFSHLFLELELLLNEFFKILQLSRAYNARLWKKWNMITWDQWDHICLDYLIQKSRAMHFAFRKLNSDGQNSQYCWTNPSNNIPIG